MDTKPIILALALWLMPSLSAFAQTTFTRITTGAIVNDGGHSDGCAWGDYDNDGFLDLFVANCDYHQNNFLYHNNGNGSFTKITTGAIVNDSDYSNRVSWGDYDNDGFLDLFVANNENENNFLYRNNGNGTFSKITTGAIANDSGYSSDASWGDYDNDGFLDLFVANYPNNLLFRNNGNGSFTKITTGAIVNEFGIFITASWGDYDNDGFLDLFVATSRIEGSAYDQNNFLYHNNGNGSFTKITTGAIVNEGGYSSGASWGDYDNDGFIDLFVANYDQNNFLYHNNGNGSFTKITTGAIVNDGGFSLGASWGDYDNDGFIDLFVANSGDNNFLYHNNGNGTFSKITTGAIVNDSDYSNGASWGDYDNDGFLDLFVANSSDQNNFLYRNNGNGNNWINLRIIGAVSNHSGIGAKVRVKATINGTPVWQTQELSGQTGNSLNAEFGLGDATMVDSIRVQWPNGMIRDTTNVAVKQFLIVTERSFTRLATGVIVNDDGDSQGCAWGDYDNDGFLDLFVVNNENGNNFLYRNNGNGTFSKITTSAIVNEGGSSGASWGDYDNDGFLDLFVVNNENGNNFLYRNNGNGSFTKITTGAIVNDGGHSYGASWGDYDNDGFLDLFVANAGFQNNFLYRNNGNGSFTKITTGDVVNDAAMSTGASWGDYDNDGFLDLFVTNAYSYVLGNNNFLYRNNGNGTFSKITTGAIVNDREYSPGASWADYDNDGFLDLFVANHNQNNFLYHNNGNGNNWINLHLVGTVSNHSGIGAKVRVKTTINDAPVWQMQELSGQTGSSSQNSLNVEFGLKKASIVDSIQIRWPSGAVNGYANMKVDQFLTLRENNRPLVQNNIPFVTLSPDSSVFVRDLNADPVVFTDRDGDTLNYKAISNNPIIVTAVFSGSRLVVSLVSDTTLGQAQITVKADDGRADDGRGNTEEMTFEINRTPYILENITDVKLLVSDKFVKDLKKVFKDADGDKVSYQASSSDTSTALVAFSESKLVIVPFDTGSTMITLTAEDERGGKTTIQFGVSVIISPAPEIKHEPITIANLREEIPITAQITDDENAVGATLNYRLGGARSFVSLLMEDHPDSVHTFRATIPASAVTDRGLEYFIEAKDNHNEISHDPEFGVLSVRVRVGGEGVINTRPQPAGDKETSYHLFSIPLDADNKSPQAVLEDDLGPKNIKKWRLYDIAADTTTAAVTYVEYPNTAAMAPGKAFWLIIKEPGQFIDTGPGVTVPTAEPYAISLRKGWNLAGNPFNFPASAEDNLSDGRPLKFYAREGGGWSDPLAATDREWQPFEGYAVYCSTACSMFIDPNRFSSGTSLPKAEITGAEVLWAIRIRAQCQEARDGNNVAAVVEQASREYDRLDQPEPPVIGEYVSAYFPHHDWPTLAKTYCLDARPELVEGPPLDGEVWEFEVKTNISDKVNLSFEGMESVPEELEVWLVDEALKITQNLREQRQYAVAGTEQGKQLKLVVGKHDFVDEKLAEVRAIPSTYELSQNFPNPFNPVTTIRYGLPKTEHVTLKIYNLLGAEVATLVDNEPKAAGYHATIWDGRDKNGRVIASGVYVYRLQVGSFVMTKKMAVVK